MTLPALLPAEVDAVVEIVDDLPPCVLGVIEPVDWTGGVVALRRTGEGWRALNPLLEA